MSVEPNSKTLPMWAAILAFLGVFMSLYCRAMADGDAVSRGAYLATASDCIACHTVPKGPAFAGGDAIATPFGKIYPPNITPDKDTGIGYWSDQDFIRAMWHGIGRQGEHLYPAFPYTDFTKLSERDVLDIRAYLATVTPINHTTPPNDLVFPFNIRALMWAWNLLFLDDSRFAGDPRKSEVWNRGAYLITGMAHCGACHTPRNLLQAERSDRMFAGTTSTGWYAPNISSSPADGIGGWSDIEIRKFLRNGSDAAHGVAGGPMAMAILDSFKNLTDSDLDAIVVYLRSVPPQDDPGHWPHRETAKPNTYDRPGATDTGAMLYQGACARCHGADGMGVKDFPAIAVDRTVTGPDAANVIQIILNGADPDTMTGVKRMPAFGDRFTDLQVAAIVNALLDKFRSRAPYVTAQTVHDLRPGN